ncbi:MarR family winged helix-turn-helix transcriptional regulator [Aurantiacibacter rhizosphaerae]|uniref:MarR family transcriptional regulator n=1 Tax=Aurantiacibacter rhizosphaerae TaxID=2691582 RepID=A0A844XGA8_9SPHN|nr:MarR family winged helix-turn-helix transcriptional regulator [Aurantiacibacter rhizosphaerae]MWV29056.1 MarR family transcriptional regulator [Aurantiacibacter rhizosphaerae]
MRWDNVENNYEFDFSKWPFYWLARADRTYLTLIEKALARVGLDVPSWRVLMILHGQQTASVSEISEHAIVKLSTMTKIIQRMQVEGLVTSGPSEEDRRVTIVTITEEGERRGRDAWRECQRISDRVFSDFTDVETQILVSLLQKLSGSLQEY